MYKVLKLTLTKKTSWKIERTDTKNTTPGSSFSLGGTFWERGGRNSGKCLHFVLVNFCKWPPLLLHTNCSFFWVIAFNRSLWRLAPRSRFSNFPLFVSLFRTICSECGFERSKKFSIWNWKFDQTVAKEETQRKFCANLNNQRSFRWRASTQFTALPEEIKEWQNTQLFLNKLKRFTLANFKPWYSPNTFKD